MVWRLAKAAGFCLTDKIELPNFSAKYLFAVMRHVVAVAVARKPQTRSSFKLSGFTCRLPSPGEVQDKGKMETCF